MYIYIEVYIFDKSTALKLSISLFFIKTLKMGIIYECRTSRSNVLWRLVQFLMFSSLEFFRENENYTFLESLESCESENQCWHFFSIPPWPPSWIFLKIAISCVVTIVKTCFWCLNIHFRGHGIEWNDLECCKI